MQGYWAIHMYICTCSYSMYMCITIIHNYVLLNFFFFFFFLASMRISSTWVELLTWRSSMVTGSRGMAPPGQRSLPGTTHQSPISPPWSALWGMECLINLAPVSSPGLFPTFNVVCSFQRATLKSWDGPGDNVMVILVFTAHSLCTHCIWHCI